MENLSAPSGSPERSPERSAFVRATGTPDVAPRRRLYIEPEPLREVELTAPGFLSASAVVAAKDVTPELLEQLAQQLHELPKLYFGTGSGAVDIQLEAADGSHVKSGSVVLEGTGARAMVPLDAATRRFRMGGLAPGDYELRAASAEAGAATTRLDVREGDVAYRMP